MSQSILKWGNSLAVRIPKVLAEEAGLSEGDRVKLEATEGRIDMCRSDRVPTLAELVAQITPENRYGEVPAGKTRGRESVEW